MLRAFVITCFILTLNASLGFAQPDSMLVEGFESLDGWRTGGQKEISYDLSDKYTKEGQYSLHLHVEMDHEHKDAEEKPKYPMGWPSVTKEYESGIDLSEYDFLELDIYYESERRLDPDFAIHIIVKDSKGRGIYSTTFIDLRDRKWAHEKLCIRDISNIGDFGYLHFFLSESVYDHGDVINFYIDNLRATKASDYQPPVVEPVRHLVAESDTALLWVEGSARKVMRTEELSLAGTKDSVVKMSAARNETEAIQLVVRPIVEGGVGQVSLGVGDLKGADGAGISAENVFWSQVYYVPAREGNLPDGLPGPKPFAADEQWQYPIWLEVYVPPDTPAGDYSAPVTVHTDKGELSAKLNLHVWNFDIPVKQHLRTSTTIYTPYGWRDDIKKWYGNMDYWQAIREWRPGIVKMLAKYRLCPSNLYHLPLEYDEESRKVVIKDTAEFEKYAQSYLDMGHHFDGMPVPYFFNRGSFLGAKKGTEEYLKRITEAYRIAAEYLDAKGWLEGSYVYCVDEAVVHKHSYDIDFDLLNRVFDAIHAAHPKIKIFGAETPSPMLRGMNIWCINLNSFDTDILEEQHALGNHVWWYNGYVNPRPGTRISARGVDHRALFWITYKYGIDGYLIWTVNRWSNNPWEEPNRGDRVAAGNHFLLYPNPDGTVSPSIRICMMRDGLEDYEYHWLLEQATKKLRDAGKTDLADECEETIKSADAFILAYDNCPHIKPEFIYESRRLLAEQIEKVQEMLK